MNRLKTSLALIVVLLGLIACGSRSEAVKDRDRSLTTQRTGNPTVKVWVNTNSGVYHCPARDGTGRPRAGDT